MTGPAVHGIPPLVYIGPTISGRDVEAVLPGAEVRPPVRRATSTGTARCATRSSSSSTASSTRTRPSPTREVVDVAEDGAWVVGASEHGSAAGRRVLAGGGGGHRVDLPAVPAGQPRVGRRGRRGLRPGRSGTVVGRPGQRSRAAVAAATRRGVLPPEVGRRLVEVARDTFYPDRHWRPLLRRAGVDDPDGALEGRLSAFDLKHTDAVRALPVRGAPAGRGSLPHPSTPTRHRSLRPLRSRRERPHAAGDDRTPDELRLALAAYLLASGRYPPRGDGRQVGEVAAYGAVTSPERIWQDLEERGELDASLFRLRALRDAPDEARRMGIAPGPTHRAAADREIADRHGCSSWSELEGRLDPGSPLGSWILDYREVLPWALCLREALFKPN